LRHAQGSNLFIAAAPRYLIETIAMVLIAAIAYGLFHQREGFATALPVLGALALGAQRLLQAVQVAYGSWAGLTGSKASLADALDLLDQPLPSTRDRENPSSPLSLRNRRSASRMSISATTQTGRGSSQDFSLDHTSRRAHRPRRYYRQRQEHRAGFADGPARSGPW
jgi:hypothetical protein